MNPKSGAQDASWDDIGDDLAARFVKCQQDRAQDGRVICKTRVAPMACNGFAFRGNPQSIAPEVLLTYLRLPIICELMDLHTSASLYPAISERDLLKLPIPRIADKTAQPIIIQVRQAHAARQQALLAKAKRAVEVAIEEGEKAALILLAGKSWMEFSNPGICQFLPFTIEAGFFAILFTGLFLSATRMGFSQN